MSEIPEIDPEIADLTHPAAHFLPGERVLRADEADRIRRSALDRQAREIVEALRADADEYHIAQDRRFAVQDAADLIERRFAPKEADPR